MSSNETNSSEVLLPPDQQTMILLGPSGQANITLPVGQVDTLYQAMFSQAINYGSQIGACFIMLTVLLVMTPKARFKRAPTIIYISALTLGMIRALLLALFYPSSWLELYTATTGDVQFVAKVDYNVQVAANSIGIPITILVETALFLQAWSMLQLWPRIWKIPAVLLSFALVITTIGFNFAVSILQSLYVIYGFDPNPKVWVRKTYLGLVTASISWFCFLFISRLAIHMWSTHSILPSLKGLNAMDVLVITNGLLMLIPGKPKPPHVDPFNSFTRSNPLTPAAVLFTGLQWGEFVNFESGSLTMTSVIVILPLGTLVAQRLANPSSSYVSNAGVSSAASASGASKRRLLSHGHTNRTHGSTVPDSPLQPNGKGTTTTGVTSQISSAASSPMVGSEKSRGRGGGYGYPTDNIDAELARIDGDEHGEDLEQGQGVRMTRSIQRSVEHIGDAAANSGTAKAQGTGDL